MHEPVRYLVKPMTIIGFQEEPGTCGIADCDRSVGLIAYHPTAPAVIAASFLYCEEEDHLKLSNLLEIKDQTLFLLGHYFAVPETRRKEMIWSMTSANGYEYSPRGAIASAVMEYFAGRKFDPRYLKELDYMEGFDNVGNHDNGLIYYSNFPSVSSDEPELGRIIFFASDVEQAEGPETNQNDFGRIFI